MKLHTYVSAHTQPTARGANFGLAHAKEITDIASRYLRFFRSSGLSDSFIRNVSEQAHDALSTWRPALATEMEATAQAAGIELWQLAAVNARTEVLAAAKQQSYECSTMLHVPENGDSWGMQTWDWHPSLVPDALVWKFPTATGHTVTTFTEFGAQAKIGVNTAGIGVLFNILSHHSDTGVGGVPLHSIARAILEEATSLHEVRSIIASAPVSASTSLSVVEATAENHTVTSFELSPVGVGEVSATDRTVLRTNHFLDAALSEGDSIALVESKTHERRSHLIQTAQRVTQHAESSAARSQILGENGAHEVLCFTPQADLPESQQWQTLVTACVLPATASLELSLQPPGSGSATVFTRY